MRKSFTQLFGFLLLSVMMLFSSGLFAQEVQSTVELYAGSSVDKCYNVSNSYTSTISVRDFIKMKSFSLTLNFDKSEFAFDAVANANALLGTPVTATVDNSHPLTGIVKFTWTNTAEVTIGDNVTGGTSLFDAKFKTLNFPNNLGHMDDSGDYLFDSPLAWDIPNSTYYYVSNGYDPLLNPTLGGSYQVETTRFKDGALNVPVSYTAANFSYTTVDATCDGGDAKITITSPVGTGLKYYFNGSTTASTTPTATAEAPSVNTVRIVDANGCYSHLFSMTVNAPEPLNFIRVTHENPLCFNDNGEIQFEIAGGTAPYTYWVVPAANFAQVQTDLDASLGITTAPVFAPYKNTNFQVLRPAGMYYVFVNDANGCSDLDIRDDAKWKTVTITPVNDQITYTAGAVNNTCNVNPDVNPDGSITVSGVAGGTGPDYTVSIDGINWVAIDGGTGSYTFPKLAAKTYTVSVKDINGCTITKDVAVTQPGAIVFTTTYTDASCSGGTTGSISIPTVTGGTGTYEFVVTTAGAAMPDPADPSWKSTTSGSFPGLPANYYSVWVRDANGCIKAFANQDGSGNILPIQAPDALTFATNADNADAIEVSCNGGDFTLTVTAAGGTAPYTYSFDGGTTYTTTNTFALTGLIADASVSVFVKDANNCNPSKTVTVDVPDLLAIESFTNTLPPTCSLGTDGRTTVNATGGVGPYWYSTDNINWFINKVLALPEGATKVWVRDAKLCTANLTVTIPALIPSAFTAAPTGLIECNGNTTTQGIAITGLTWIAGRTIQYFVTNSSGNVSVFVPASVNGIAPVSPVVSTKFGAGTYSVSAHDQYGCISDFKTVVFLQNPALQLDSVEPKPATCATLFDGTLTIKTLGGNGQPYYAIVNNLIAINNLTWADFKLVESYIITTDGIKVGKQVVQALKGTYYVVIRDNCITDNSIYSVAEKINGFDPIALIESASTYKVEDITCHDANNGTITVTGVTGGEPGGYTGYVSTAGYIYKLYLTGTPDVLSTNITGKFTGKFTDLSAGNYYVTITDVTNCPLYKTSIKTVVNPETLTITNVAVTHFTCVTSNDGIVAITAAGGTGTYWLAVNASVNGLGTDVKASDWIAFPSTSPTTKPYIATEPGLYKFYVKDANGCLATPVTVTVLAPKVITPVVAVNTPVTCNNSLVPDGAVHIHATGGFETTTPSFVHTYLFSLNSGFTGGLDKTNTTGDFTPLAAGTYTVYVKATNTPAFVPGAVSYTYPMVACTYQLTFEVKQPTEYWYTGKVIKHVACKGSNEGELDVTVISGGTPFKNLTNGDEYDVQLTTTAYPLVNPTKWIRTTGKVAKFINLPHAIYSVWIKDANGCKLPTGAEYVPPIPVPIEIDQVWHKVASWEVMEPGTALTASVTWNNDVTCFGWHDGKFTVTATGGDDGFDNTDTYKYAAKKSILPAHVFAPEATSTDEWQTSNVFDQATAATWIVWAMVVHDDGTYCIVGGEGTGTPVDEWRVQVRQPVQVDFTLASAEAKCFGAATGTITASSLVSAAGAPYSITVIGTDAAGNAVNITRSALAANNVVAINIPASVTKHDEPSPAHSSENAYTVTVTDKNGCSNLHTIVVWQNPELLVNIVKAAGAFVCPGDNNGVIEAVAYYKADPDKFFTGGTNWNLPDSFTYQLSNETGLVTAWQPIPSFLVEVGHTWKVEVRDGNGCEASDDEILNTPIGVTASLKETTCYSDAKASVIISAVGETGRTFLIRYRRNTEVTFGAWAPFTSEIAIHNLIFANSIEEQNFYYFEVEDDKGCNTTFYKSFVPTQHPLEATLVQFGDQVYASLLISGGVSPYYYQDGNGAFMPSKNTDNKTDTLLLTTGEHVITIKDAHGCFVTKSITVDPLKVTANPASGDKMLNTFDVVLTFNRNVTIPVDGITVTGTGATAVITGTGNERTVKITGDDLATVNLILANTIKDAGGNTLPDTTFTYKIGDNVPPTVTAAPSSGENLAKTFTVVLTFSDDAIVTNSDVTVSINGASSTQPVSHVANVYTVKVTAADNSTVVVTAAATIADTFGNLLGGTRSFTYLTGDNTAPVIVTVNPNGGATENAHPANFEIYVNEAVVKGSGKLTVYKKTGDVNTMELDISTVTIVPIASGYKISIPLSASLDRFTDYYVLLTEGFVVDLNNNKLSAIGSKTFWTFKTGDWLTGIDPIQNVSLFKVYPNPFGEYVIVDNASKLSKIVVTNIVGQTVKEVVNPTNRIQLNELRSGVYFISLYNMDNVIAKTAKIVKR